MAFSALLVHTAQTYRRSGDLDEFGQPSDVQQGDLYLEDVPCRANVNAGGERFGERSLDVVVETAEVFFLPGVDIREDDALEVFDQDGAKIIGLDSNITLVRRATDGTGATHHVEVLTQTIRGA